MNAGELRERLMFSERGSADDGYGNQVGPFVDQFEVWARIQPLKGSEPVIAQRMTGIQPVVIRVRVSSDTRRIATDWQARDVRKGALYNIRAIANMDERNRYFDLLADTGSVSG